jgi:hypothetical protein
MQHTSMGSPPLRRHYQLLGMGDSPELGGQSPGGIMQGGGKVGVPLPVAGRWAPPKKNPLAGVSVGCQAKHTFLPLTLLHPPTHILLPLCP